MKQQSWLNRNSDFMLAALGALLVTALVIGAGWGWISNIRELVNMDSAKAIGMFVVRCIGIFVVPLGIVLGYI